VRTGDGHGSTEKASGSISERIRLPTWRLDAIKSEAGAINLFVLEASSIVEIDYSASNILADVIKECRRSGVDFAVARLESVRAQDAFLRFGITDLLGKDHLAHSVEEAITTLRGDGTLADTH
jgi:SulP family sulfate permease